MSEALSYGDSGHYQSYADFPVEVPQRPVRRLRNDMPSDVRQRVLAWELRNDMERDAARSRQVGGWVVDQAFNDVKSMEPARL